MKEKKWIHLTSSKFRTLALQKTIRKIKNNNDNNTD